MKQGVMVYMLEDYIKSKIIKKIVEKVDPSFIILFGSFAKRTARVDSDIDLAYFSDEKLSNYNRFILAGELASIVNREVDLVDMKKIDTVFTIQIFEQGIPIYIQDKNEFYRQRMRAYSMYATLSEQRAAIIEAVRERGSVFGSE